MAGSWTSDFAPEPLGPDIDAETLDHIIHFLKACDVARYIEEDTLKQLVSKSFLKEIPDGAVFRVADVEHPSLALVLQGKVVVRLRTRADQSVTPASSQKRRQQARTADGYNVLKTLGPGAYLNSTLDLFTSLTIRLDGQQQQNDASPSSDDKLDIVYQAANGVKVAFIPLVASSIPNYASTVIAPGIRALVTKLYKVTFHHARSHFGLHEHVLDSDLALHQIPASPSTLAPTIDGVTDVETTHSVRKTPSPSESKDLPLQREALSAPNLASLASLSSDTDTGGKSSDDGSRRQRPALSLRVRTPSSSSIGIRTHKAFKPRLLMSTETPQFKNPWRKHSPETSLAIEIMLRALGVNESLLQPAAAHSIRSAMASLEIRIFDYGDIVVPRRDSYLGIYLILGGSLSARASIRTPDNTPRLVESTLEPGQLVGYSSLVLDSQAMFDFTSTAPGTTVALLPRQAARLVVNSCPDVMLRFGTRVVNAIHPIIFLTDFVMDWLTVSGGTSIYSAGDESDSIYFVVRGRVRTTEEIPGIQETRVVETSQGRSFGALEMYTGATRTATVTAVRSSDVARLQKSAYHSLVHCHPPLAINLWGKILNMAPSLVKNYWAGQVHAVADPCPPKTITVVPLSVDIPVEPFVEALSAALVAAGGYKEDDIVMVTSENIVDLVGQPIYTHAGNAYLEDSLSNLQNMAQLIILVGDHAAASTWNNVCVGNSDCFILLGMVDGSPSETDIERRIIESGTIASKILVLLEVDEEQTHCAGLTRPWIEEREWIIPGPMSGLQRLSLISEQGDHDLHRLARRIAGKSVALVLGGGGARGFTHLGVLEAFEEEGIPVDIVGGTSMGSMVAALYAKERHLDSTIEATRKFARGCAWRKFLWDWTLPILSVTTGSHLSRLVTEAVGEDTDASDLRLPFFCNVTDLMRNSSAKTLHAVAKPLWPMVRASMSVHGLVPPISLDGDLLVDGCFSSNLPVFPALSLGAHLIFAFDIGVQGEPLPADYKGMKISGWRLFGRLLRSWLWGSASTSSDGKDVLTYGIANELLTNSTNSADIQAIRALPNCLYYRQPVTHISSLDMSRFEELRKVGYDNAKTMLHKWKQEGRLDSVIMSRGDDETKTTKKATKA